MRSFAKSAEAPFAAEGGVRLPAQAVDDPYQALDDLMAVVELLCPEWPARRPFSSAGRMLL